MDENKILDNQVVLENRAVDVFDRYESLIKTCDEKNIFEIGFVPIYLMLASSENGMTNVGRPSTLSVLNNVKCIIKILSIYVRNGNRAITYDGNKLARQKDFLTELNFPMMSGTYTKQAAEHLDLIKKHFSLNPSTEGKMKKNFETWLCAQALVEFAMPRLSLEKIKIGTGSKPINQIVSMAMQKNGTLVERYSHGGDRGFFRDQLFYRTEFRNADLYNVHGFHENNGLSAPVKVNIVGSDYHASLAQPNQISGPWTNDVIYCLPSAVAPDAHFPFIKFSDKNQTLIQINIIKMLKSDGYNVKLKLHPKSRYKIDQRVYDLADGVASGTMKQCLDANQNWVFDIFGSAAIEALSAKKNILYIDLGLRRRSPYFNELRKRVFICDRFTMPSKKMLKTFFKDSASEISSFTKGFYQDDVLQN